MSKVLAVFGANGRQGGSVIDFVTSDKELSKDFKVRAITRDVNTEASKELANKVEVVAGDVNEPATLKTALAGVHTVFALTNPGFGPDAFESEFSGGKAIADAALEQGAQYIIFSSLPPVKEISGGKYTNVTNFDAKAAVEKYIRGLPIKSAFYNAGEFMENFNSFPFYLPQLQDDGTYVAYRNHPISSKTPLLAAKEDTGKFIGAILADPGMFEGKSVIGATRLYDYHEIGDILSKSTGKKVLFKEISTEEYRKTLPEFIQGIFPEVLSFMAEYNYFGPNQDKLVDESVAIARGKLTTFEEYLQQNPLKLE